MLLQFILVCDNDLRVPAEHADFQKTVSDYISANKLRASFHL